MGFIFKVYPNVDDGISSAGQISLNSSLTVSQELPVVQTTCTF